MTSTSWKVGALSYCSSHLLMMITCCCIYFGTTTLVSGTSQVFESISQGSLTVTVQPTDTYIRLTDVTLTSSHLDFTVASTVLPGIEIIVEKCNFAADIFWFRTTPGVYTFERSRIIMRENTLRNLYLGYNGPLTMDFIAANVTVQDNVFTAALYVGYTSFSLAQKHRYFQGSSLHIIGNQLSSGNIFLFRSFQGGIASVEQDSTSSIYIDHNYMPTRRLLIAWSNQDGKIYWDMSRNFSSPAAVANGPGALLSVAHNQISQTNLLYASAGLNNQDEVHLFMDSARIIFHENTFVTSTVYFFYGISSTVRVVATGQSLVSINSNTLQTGSLQVIAANTAGDSLVTFSDSSVLEISENIINSGFLLLGYGLNADSKAQATFSGDGSGLIVEQNQILAISIYYITSNNGGSASMDFSSGSRCLFQGNSINVNHFYIAYADQAGSTVSLTFSTGATWTVLSNLVEREFRVGFASNQGSASVSISDPTTTIFIGTLSKTSNLFLGYSTGSGSRSDVRITDGPLVTVAENSLTGDLHISRAENGGVVYFSSVTSTDLTSSSSAATNSRIILKDNDVGGNTRFGYAEDASSVSSTNFQASHLTLTRGRSTGGLILALAVLGASASFSLSEGSHVTVDGAVFPSGRISIGTASNADSASSLSIASGSNLVLKNNVIGDEIRFARADLDAISRVHLTGSSGVQVINNTIATDLAVGYAGSGGASFLSLDGEGTSFHFDRGNAVSGAVYVGYAVTAPSRQHLNLTGGGVLRIGQDSSELSSNGGSWQQGRNSFYLNSGSSDAFIASAVTGGSQQTVIHQSSNITVSGSNDFSGNVLVSSILGTSAFQTTITSAGSKISLSGMEITGSLSVAKTSGATAATSFSLLSHSGLEIYSNTVGGSLEVGYSSGSGATSTLVFRDVGLQTTTSLPPPPLLNISSNIVPSGDIFIGRVDSAGSSLSLSVNSSSASSSSSSTAAAPHLCITNNQIKNSITIGSAVDGLLTASFGTTNYGHHGLLEISRNENHPTNGGTAVLRFGYMTAGSSGSVIMRLGQEDGGGSGPPFDLEIKENTLNMIQIGKIEGTTSGGGEARNYFSSSSTVTVERNILSGPIEFYDQSVLNSISSSSPSYHSSSSNLYSLRVLWNQLDHAIALSKFYIGDLQRFEVDRNLLRQKEFLISTTVVSATTSSRQLVMGCNWDMSRNRFVKTNISGFTVLECTETKSMPTRTGGGPNGGEATVSQSFSPSPILNRKEASQSASSTLELPAVDGASQSTDLNEGEDSTSPSSVFAHNDEDRASSSATSMLEPPLANLAAVAEKSSGGVSGGILALIIILCLLLLAAIAGGAYIYRQRQQGIAELTETKKVEVYAEAVEGGDQKRD